MAELDFLIEQINQKGWLSISTLYFDNAYAVNIFSSRGYVAYSPSKNIFASYNTLDSTDTSIVESKYIVRDRKHFGMQQNITIVGDAHLQHFDIAQYSHYSFYFDEQEKLPYPTIPTKDELMALTPDPDTGLYTGKDIVHRMDDKEISTICLYPDVKDQYSGAVIDAWKQFYINHDKFVAMLNEAYGITDAI